MISKTIPHTNRRKSFNLTELLVAIAILAILSSLLSPSIKSAIAKSKAASCQKNIMGQLLATILFLGDHNDFFWEERLPNHRDNYSGELGPVYRADLIYEGLRGEDAETTGGQGSYKGALITYMGDIETYICPGDDQTMIGLDEADESYNRFYHSYKFSRAYDRHPLSNFFHRPSQLGAIVDGRYPYVEDRGDVFTNHGDSLTRAWHIEARHDLGAHVGFLDGRVENVFYDELNPESVQWEMLGYISHINAYAQGRRDLTSSTGGWDLYGTQVVD